MSQTSVSTTMAPFTEGQKIDLGNDDVLSYAAEGSNIPFGKAVSLGTDKDKQAILPGAAGDITDVKNFLGVALRTHALENSAIGGTGNGEYKEKDAVSVMNTGRVAVKMETAFAPTDAVEVRYAGVGDKGAFRVGNVVAETAPLANARIRNSGLANEYAILELS